LSSSVPYVNVEPAVLSITVWNGKTKQNEITTACCAKYVEKMVSSHLMQVCGQVLD
jgi:hypothetical protein